MAFELVTVPKLPARGNTMYEALEPYTGPRRAYTGSTEWVILWGPGGAMQQEIGRKHQEAGGNVAYIDIGYWHRQASAVRVSINAFHPPKYLPRALHRRPRFASQGVSTGDLYSPTGHILVCGNGPKSRGYYGVGNSWEKDTINFAKSKWPDREVYYRPKPNVRGETMPGALDGSKGDILDRLRGCAHVYVKHSNVQVEALRFNVPCSMVDGILLGHYDLSRRMELLEAISWFNWLPREAQQMLKFIETELG